MNQRGRDIETEVLIVGGGGCGLAASVMLADLGVSHVLVERHPGTALVPKAHIINPRTMEIFASHGLAEDAYRIGAPLENNSAMRWYTSLGGSEPWHRQLVHHCDAWGGGALRERYADYSAMRHGNVPQILLEPLLRTHAERRAPGAIRFHHELTGISQDTSRVTARVLNRDSGEHYTVTSRYLIAADGGKTVGSRVGIRLEGPAPFVHTESVYFRADLSAYLDEDDALIRFFNRPTLTGQPVRTGLVAAGPARWDRNSEEWTMSVTLRADEDAADFDDERAAAAIRERLNLPDLKIEVLRHMRWSIQSLLASDYQAGRVFVAGDAAHQHSPFGGLGLNTAIQDVHNLTWKLAAVLNGQADPALLDTYGAERRPVGRTNVDYATIAFFNTLAATAGFGLVGAAAAEYNQAVLEELFSDTPAGRQRRARLHEYYDTMRMEGQAADIELGFDYYASRAVVPDGTPAPPRDPTGCRYVPVSRPGHRMPHAWLEEYGKVVATHELLRPGTLLLLTGDDGQPWRDAADKLMSSTSGILPVATSCVGPRQRLRDRYAHWGQLRGHDDQGALLVRPDGHVGARLHSSVGVSCYEQLAAAAATIAGRARG